MVNGSNGPRATLAFGRLTVWSLHRRKSALEPTGDISILRCARSQHLLNDEFTGRGTELPFGDKQRTATEH